MALTKEDMQEAVASGVTEGLKKLVADEELMQRFWESGYQELSTHASKNTSQWIGKRLVTVIATGLFVWSLTWLVKNGIIKG